MVMLVESVNKWGREGFSNTLKKELIELGVDIFPSQDAATLGRFLNDSDICVTVLNNYEDKISINIVTGVIFSETQWGYCCGDEEPMVNTSYCEIHVSINKKTSKANFKPLR